MSTNHHAPRRAPSSDCARFAPLLPIHADVRADAADVAGLREHLATCAFCQEQLAEYSQLDAALSRHFGADATPRLATADLVWTVTGTSTEETNMRGTPDQRSVGATMTAPAALARAARPLPSPALDRRPPFPRRFLSWTAPIAAVLVLALLAEAIFALHGRSAAPGRPVATPTPVAADPLVMSISGGSSSCVFGTSWSPDGAQVAVAAYQHGCLSREMETASGPSGGMLTIYDSRTGDALSTVGLDAPAISKVIPQNVRDDPAKMAQVGIYYQHLRWSPNGRVLALDFGEQQWEHDQGLLVSQAQGLITIEVQTGAVGVLVLTPSSSASSGSVSGTSFAPASTTRWDLAAGTASTVQIPQALSYTWGQSGTLVPLQPLPSSPDAAPPSVAPGPVGNPDGGQVFSIWQTLEVNVDRYCPLPDQPNLSPPPTPYFAVSASVSAWSPDGRYLIEPFTVLGRLAMKPAFASAAGGSGDSMAAHTALAPLLPLSCGGPIPAASAFAQVPMRDVGMQSALATLTDYGSLSFTWSPNGTRIVMSTGGYTKPTIMIFDTRTGAVAAQFSADATRFGVPVASPTAQPQLPHILWLDEGAGQGGWSPDGRRMLLVDAWDGMLVIVGPKELGG